MAHKQRFACRIAVLATALAALLAGAAACDDGSAPADEPAPGGLQVTPQSGVVPEPAGRGLGDEQAKSATAPLDAARFVPLYAEVECALARDPDPARRDETVLAVLQKHDVDFAAYVAARRDHAGPQAEAARAACLPAVASARYAPADDELLAVKAALDALATRKLAPADQKSREVALFARHGLTREAWQMAFDARAKDDAFRDRLAKGPRPAAADLAADPPAGARVPDAPAALAPNVQQVIQLAAARACVLKQGWPADETDKQLAALYEGYRIDEDTLDDAIERYGQHPVFVEQFRSVTSVCSPADMAVPPEGLYAPPPTGSAAPPASAPDPAVDGTPGDPSPAEPTAPQPTGPAIDGTPATSPPIETPPTE